MAVYEANVETSWERSANDRKGTPSTTATIVVKPPIVPGPFFGRVVLGEYADEQEITFVGSTQEASVFIGESWREGTSVNDRLQEIRTMGDRIVCFANNPGIALTMLHESPFAIAPVDYKLDIV